MASELDFSKLLPSIGGLVYGTIHRKKAWKNAQKTMISWRFSYGFPWFPMFLRRPEVVLVPASGTRRRRDGQKIGDPTYQEVGDVHVHISLYVSDIYIYTYHIIYIYYCVYIYTLLYIYIYTLLYIYIYILLIYIYIHIIWLVILWKWICTGWSFWGSSAWAILSSPKSLGSFVVGLPRSVVPGARWA